MEVARRIMEEDGDVLRALAELDRTGQFTLDGKTYGPDEMAAISADMKARRVP